MTHLVSDLIHMGAMTAFFQWQEADRNNYELFHLFTSLHCFIHEVSRNCEHPIKQIICFHNYYQSYIIQKPHSKSFCSVFFPSSGAYEFFSGDKKGASYDSQSDKLFTVHSKCH